MLLSRDLLLLRCFFLELFAFTISLCDLGVLGVWGKILSWVLVICFKGELGSCVWEVRFLADAERLIAGTICHLSTGAAGLFLRRM